ncbi:T9SS type A sorting domain-containing protein [uncultured Cytophaga sp.]|uniref:T9SS type A sorting domain-containing protein n=1 Tax=uncultured Cytophaga sp. TaxID=160238 RepID=UPI002635AC09|nr:T9SS type A sorting domain-containing protein [uncultured Cytophaga sp.]
MPDSGFAPISLYARDGLLIYNAADKYRRYQWYASSDTLFNFRKTVNQGEAVSLSWSGPGGGWVSMPGRKLLKYDKGLDSLVAICDGDNFDHIHAYITGNITFHKNRYYMTGAVPNPDGSQEDMTVVLIFDPSICKWTKLDAVTKLYRLFQQGNSLYVTSNGTANEDIVYKSDDEAVSWQKVTLPAYYFGDSTYYPKTRFNTDQEGNVIVRISELTKKGIDSTSTKVRFYLLQNGSFNLLAMTNANPNNTYPYNRTALEGGFRSSGAGRLYAIAPGGQVPQYEVKGDILLTSVDQGNSWEKIDARAPEYMTDVVETSNGRVFATTDVGVYELKITKPQGCSNLTHTTKVYSNGRSCNNFNIEVHVSGGQKPYQITLNNKTYQTNDSIIVSDTLGLYPINISDNKGCTLNTSALVSRQHTDSLHVLFGYPLPSYCNDGSFAIMIWKGKPPYTVQWTDGSSTYEKKIPKEMDYTWGPYEYFPLTKIGAYNFLVKDSLGCKIYSDTIHKRLLQTKVTYTPTASCDSATADIEVLSTISDINYVMALINNDTILRTQWSDKTITVKLPYNANNNIIIEDKYNCRQDYYEHWTKSSASLGYVSNIGCDSMGALGHAPIILQNANQFTTIHWSDINRDTFLTYRDKLTAGHYSVIVKDKLMCANATLDFDITEQPIPRAKIPPFLCVGNTYTIKPYVTNPNITGFFFYGLNRQSEIGDSLVFTMPNLVDTIVNIFFVNQNPQCASSIQEFEFKRNTSVKPLTDSLITVCNPNQQIELNSSDSSTIWYSQQQQRIIDTNNTIHFKPTSLTDTIWAYMKTSMACYSDTSIIAIRQTDFNYDIDKSTYNSWIYLHGGKSPYRMTISGNTMLSVSNITDTVWLGNILTSGTYKLSIFDSDNCDITLQDISIDNDAKKKEDFILYPNPANDYIQIAGINQFAEITIYSSDGKKVFEGISSNSQIITLPYMAAALYLVRIVEGDRKKICKLIIK